MRRQQPSTTYSDSDLKGFRQEHERDRDGLRFDRYARDQEELRQKQENAICVRRAGDGSCAEYRSGKDVFDKYRIVPAKPRTYYDDDGNVITGTSVVARPPAKPSILSEHPLLVLGIAAVLILRVIQAAQARTISDWFGRHRRKFAALLVIVGSGLLVEGLALSARDGSIPIGTMMLVGGGLLLWGRR